MAVLSSHRHEGPIIIQFDLSLQTHGCSFVDNHAYP